MHIDIKPFHIQKHLIQFEIEFDEVAAGEHILQWPIWRPGRYEPANYAQNVLEIAAIHCGEQVSLQKITKDKWQFATSATGPLKLTYIYYAHQMDAGASWLDHDQLYLNFVNCVPYFHDRQNEEITIELKVDDDYQLATSLQKVGDQGLVAENYDVLVDSPLIASRKLSMQSYEVNGTIFFVWVNGKCELEWDKLLNDFRRFTQSQIALFGGYPSDEFHFLFQVLPYRHYHGVEHKDSTVICLGPSDQLNSDKIQTDLLGISSHELFHIWNIKRIRPQELIPYKFDQEQYFDTGYIAEGVTTYYGDLMLARSGVFSPQDYLNEVNIYLKRHFENDGRLRASLTQSSVDLWIDGYKQGLTGRKVSIYIKGALIALILDLKIRELSQNKQSLDDVMREMWTQFGDLKKGYKSLTYRQIIEKLTQQDWGWYFDDCVYGKADLTSLLNNVFDRVGCEMKVKHSEDYLKRWLGIEVQLVQGKFQVIKTGVNSPGEEKFSVRDEIITINTTTVTSLTQELLVKDGENVIEIMRAGERMSMTVKLNSTSYFDVYEVVMKSDPSLEETNNFNSWILDLEQS